MYQQKQEIMSTLKLVAEDQIQRVNQLVNAVREFQELPMETLMQKPDSKSWCILEVLEHMSIAYENYRPRIEKLLRELPDAPTQQTTFKAHTFSKLFIHMIKPKGTKRKWKLKTMKKFEPGYYHPTLKQPEITKLFERFYDNKAHLKQAIIDSRSKKVDHRRIASAIGPLVKFYLPEAYEFIICHAERHVVQIREIQEAVTDKKAPTLFA